MIKDFFTNNIILKLFALLLSVLLWFLAKGGL
jgi:hypothetical protein